MKYTMQTIVVALVVVFVFVLIRRAPQSSEIPREEVWIVMGTVASLRTPASDRADFRQMLQIAKETFDEVNTALSVYNPHSELSTLHQTGKIEDISPLTREFLSITQQMVDRTQGLFDPTLLPVIQLWGFSGGRTPSALPTAAEIALAMERPKLDDLEISASYAQFRDQTGHIDPGGIAKGFALDRAFDRIVNDFPEAQFLLNLGGEMRARGEAAHERPWRIGIQHPFRKNVMIGVLLVPDRFAVATSGHYERYFEIDGQRYAHIIDPDTGWPVKNMAGVTVLSPNSTDADVLSTALFVAGLDRTPHILQAFPATEALLIPDLEPVQIYVTEGLKPFLEIAPAYQDNIKTLPLLSNY